MASYSAERRQVQHDSLHKAIETARTQQAKSLELRATMSPAQLCGSGGVKASEAHHMLVTVHQWFAERFDTADLQDAKRLTGRIAKRGRGRRIKESSQLQLPGFSH